jgi:uncharacterized protein (DUF1501 family)
MLLLVGLAGGNDQLSTIAPVSQPEYQALRGKLALTAETTIPLNGGWAMNGALANTGALWRSTQVSVVQGVWHPHGSLSHFQSMAAWMGGHASGGNPGSGWLGRYSDGFELDGLPSVVSLGESVPLLLRGNRAPGIAIPDDLSGALGSSESLSAPEDRRLIAELQNMTLDASGNPAKAAVQTNMKDSLEVTRRLSDAMGKPVGDGLRRRLTAAARIFNAGLGIRVVHVTQGAYDTHAGQQSAHSALLQELDSGLAAFFSALAPPVRPRVTVLTYSEFGRRPHANGSGGTDHGTATDYLLISPEARSGFAGEAPSLSRLDESGNLVGTTDFRQVIATIVDDVLGADHREIIGKSFEKLSLIRSAADPPGYWMLNASAEVAAFGNRPFLGCPPTGQMVAAICGHPNGCGYWVAARDGSVYAFGTARDLGGLNARPLAQPIVDIAAGPSGNGYWMLGADGGVFAFGDAQFFGSTGGTRLNRPVVAMTATPSGRGYWFVASDGGVFCYGDARFFGSMGGRFLAQPIVGMSSTSSGAGYWLVAADGGVFCFGDAQFFGSTGSVHLVQPIVGIARTPSSCGYWLVAEDGGVFAFGDAQFSGSMVGTRSRVVGFAA